MRKRSPFLARAIQTAVQGNSASNERYNLYWVNDGKSLDFACERGLLGLYRRVFAEPPYNEDFTNDQVYGEFQDTLKQDGLVFMATEKQGLDRVLGFVSSLPLTRVPEVATSVAGAVDPDKAAYFAEDGVEKDYRRKGISSLMKNMLIQANWMSGADHIVLRTSDQNYRQAAAVTKAGGQVISGAFQHVASPRQGGQIMQDRRAFFLFTPEQETNYDYLQRVSIVRPGGNDTAIVWDNIPRRQQGDIASSIQKTYPGVEQVMFIERNPENGRIRGQMAGGEFCGNATRSLGYLLLDGKDGTIDVEVSGANRPMTVVVKNGQAMTEIPVKPDLESIKALPSGETIANLDGISHLITRDDQQIGQRLNSISDLETRKLEVKKVLDEVGLSKEPASGVMVTSERPDGKLRLDPYVYVRDTGTLYYETGCGSGSTAIGLSQAKANSQSVDSLEIIQPSGLPLVVSVQRGETAFKQATVNGPVEVMFDSRMYLPRQVIEKKQSLTP